MIDFCTQLMLSGLPLGGASSIQTNSDRAKMIYRSLGDVAHCIVAYNIMIILLHVYLYGDL